jgi:two-component system sensor histidine kinase DesK
MSSTTTSIPTEYACEDGPGRRRWLGPAAAVVWLIWLAAPLSEFLDDHPSLPMLIVGLAGFVVFSALYGIIYTRRTYTRADAELIAEPPILWLMALALIAIAIAFTLGLDSGWSPMFVFCATGTAAIAPLNRGPLAIVGVVVTYIATAFVAGLSSGEIAGMTLTIGGLGFMVYSFARLHNTIYQLRRARAEIAELAVSEERLRIARDLHDLLGHNLSLLALKSELAGRLIEADPARAAAEIKDIETVSRSALREVREAVSDYRRPTLARERHAASELLEAAGIACFQTGSAGELPADVEAVLAWGIREGVTNVVRHSEAKRCAIRLDHEDGQVSAEITDDGHGCQRRDGVPAGNGLNGLRERIVQLGGSLDLGTAANGSGFRLCLTLPVPNEATVALPEGARA